MAYSSLLNFAAILMSIQLSVQAQPAVAGRSRLWLWVLLLLIVGAVIAWLLGREDQQLATTSPLPATPKPEPNHPQPVPSPPPVEVTRSAMVEVDVAPPAEAASELVQPDDLTKLEGIGPKINALLQANGFHTFANLAQADVAILRQILVEAGLRIHDPTTWPEQAALAAAGQWESLSELQARLKAGRRSPSQS
jgi:predicted flap endonuclease-1-like 5' DNA nuclease